VKLLDFALDDTLNRLRKEMGDAPLEEIFQIPVVPSRPRKKITLPPRKLLDPNPPVIEETRVPTVVIRSPSVVPVRPAPAFVSSSRVNMPSGVFEVDYGDVSVGSLGELRYQGKRAIFYIRDVSSYQGNFTLPKFHVADCATRQGMKTKNLNERFIAATRFDGYFQLNVDGRKRDVQLSVCQHCLEALSWKGFSRSLSTEKKQRRVREFSLQEYLS
jgi:hypothetical protein